MSTTTNTPSFTLPITLTKPTSEARTTLLTHLRLLHLLHHRSKNQHRRSHWYRHFNLLRRQVQALCVDLQIDLGPGFPSPPPQPPTTATARKAKSKKLPTRYQASAGAAIGGRAEPLPNSAINKTTQRLQHWTEMNLIPKCYIAFSSLMTTPSFAPLALTLLAVLGRLSAVTGVTGYLRSIAANEDGETGVNRAEKEDMGEVLKGLQRSEAADMEDADLVLDIGVPVERETTARTAPPPPDIPKKRPAKRRKRGNEIDALFGV